jgi:hypothetical protein
MERKRETMSFFRRPKDVPTPSAAQKTFPKQVAFAVCGAQKIFKN